MARSSNWGPRGHDWRTRSACRMLECLSNKPACIADAFAGDVPAVALKSSKRGFGPAYSPSHLGHPSLGLVLLNNTPGFNIAQAAFNLLADVDVVLDVFP